MLSNLSADVGEDRNSMQLTFEPIRPSFTTHEGDTASQVTVRITTSNKLRSSYGRRKAARRILVRAGARPLASTPDVGYTFGRGRVRLAPGDEKMPRATATATAPIAEIKDGFPLGHAGEGNYPPRDPYGGGPQRRLVVGEANGSPDLRTARPLGLIKVVESKSYVWSSRQNRNNSVAR